MIPPLAEIARCCAIVLAEEEIIASASSLSNYKSVNWTLVLDYKTCNVRSLDGALQLRLLKRRSDIERAEDNVHFYNSSGRWCPVFTSRYKKRWHYAGIA